MPQANLEKLAAYLKSRTDVVFAVVFGSASNGVVPPGSDLDLGVYFAPMPEGEDYIRFLVEAAEAAEFDVIDLVPLQTADTILAFEALSGHVLCKSDPERTAAFTSLVCREYESIMIRFGRAA